VHSHCGRFRPSVDLRQRSPTSVMTSPRVSAARRFKTKFEGIVEARPLRKRRHQSINRPALIYPPQGVHSSWHLCNLRSNHRGDSTRAFPWAILIPGLVGFTAYWRRSTSSGCLDPYPQQRGARSVRSILLDPTTSLEPLINGVVCCFAEYAVRGLHSGLCKT
jgi:hypothetical protein